VNLDNEVKQNYIQLTREAWQSSHRRLRWNQSKDKLNWEDYRKAKREKNKLVGLDRELLRKSKKLQCFHVFSCFDLASRHS
jgi:hypothetical protein